MVLANPISGAGRAAAAAERVSRRLAAIGHHVQSADTRLEPPESWLDAHLEHADLLIVAGGDGAVRLAAASAARSGVPIYHFPFGTENLFAREFGMNRNEELLISAIKRFEVRAVDMGIANGRIFLSMASVGYDAEVVHDLALRRGSSISHFSYLAPMMAQLQRWTPPHLEVLVDGKLISTTCPGFVVVANSRQYGWRLNPAGRASMNDGLLDVAYFPACSRRELIGWAWRCRLQRQFRDRRFVYGLGRNITITSDKPQRYQLDGDPPDIFQPTERTEMDATAADQPFLLEISVQPGALRVLMP